MYSMYGAVNPAGTDGECGTGWLPPLPDLRDYTEAEPSIAELARRLRLPGIATLGAPAAPVDLRPWCSPVEDQKALGSCTAHAAMGMVEYFERRAFGKYLDGSRLFVYKATRNLMRVTGDTGAWLRNTMGALKLCGVREPEGPFGEFTGHYSGGRSHPVIEVKKVWHRHAPIFEQIYLGMPWTELDYLIGLTTCVPIYSQLKRAFPNEIFAVNAMYTHGLVAIISTASRYGGFAKAVAMHTLSTPHGLGYCKVVIMVDADVDPFNLPQVMWAISTKVQPGRDIVTIPGLSVVPLDPGSEPPGITDKVIIDATTPIAPDRRGNYGQPLDAPAGTAEWQRRLAQMIDGLTSRGGAM